MLKTNNWNIRLDTTTELSCILNIHHAMDNVQCNWYNETTIVMNHYKNSLIYEQTYCSASVIISY